MKPFDLDSAERSVIWFLFGFAGIALALVVIAALGVSDPLAGPEREIESTIVLRLALGAAGILAALGVIRWRQRERASGRFWSPVAYRLGGVAYLAAAFLAIARAVATSSLEIALSAGASVFGAILCFRLASHLCQLVHAQRHSAAL